MLAQRFILRSSLKSLINQNSVARYAIHPGTAAYDGDGKTKVSIMNSDAESGLMINAFSQMGFRLNNGIMVLGPMAIFPK
jgi:NADH dehydrogenase [ubiquinone] 1 alpha subcomplex assembly factor 3